MGGGGERAPIKFSLEAWLTVNPPCLAAGKSGSRFNLKKQRSYVPSNDPDVHNITSLCVTSYTNQELHLVPVFIVAGFQGSDL